MSQDIKCDICEDPIVNLKYYLCETCNKTFHHNCVYKEKQSFPGVPRKRRCKYCGNLMIDRETYDKFKLKRKMLQEKLQAKEALVKGRMDLLDEKIIAAAQSYTTIKYKQLAKILGCKAKDLLNEVTKLVNDGKIKAQIHLPFITFESN